MALRGFLRYEGLIWAARNIYLRYEGLAVVDAIDEIPIASTLFRRFCLLLQRIPAPRKADRPSLKWKSAPRNADVAVNAHVVTAWALILG